MLVIKTDNSETSDFQFLDLIFKINKDNKIQVDLKGCNFYLDVEMILSIENTKLIINELQNFLKKIENNFDN